MSKEADYLARACDLLKKVHDRFGVFENDLPPVLVEVRAFLAEVGEGPPDWHAWKPKPKPEAAE